MGNVSHLCFSPLTIVAPTYFTTASLDDTPGEQMCSNDFTVNSDVRDFFFFSHYFFCHSAQCKVISCTARRSKPRNKPFQSLRVVKQHVPDCTITHKYSLLCKLAQFLSRLHDFIFNYSFPCHHTSFFFPLSLFFFSFFFYLKSVTAWVLN